MRRVSTLVWTLVVPAWGLSACARTGLGRDLTRDGDVRVVRDAGRDGDDPGDDPAVDRDAPPDADTADDLELSRDSELGTELSDIDDGGGDRDAPNTTNACGGAWPLEWQGAAASPGGACGLCGDGLLECADADTLRCAGAIRTWNACGGCADLSEAAGGACGACGLWLCAGPDAVSCVEAPERCDEGRTLVAKLLPSDAYAGNGAVGDRFGAAVARLGDEVLIGAPGAEDAGPGAGLVYAFEKRGGVWGTDVTWSFSGARAFGRAVAGEVDADRGWLVVGAERAAFAFSVAGDVAPSRLGPLGDDPDWGARAGVTIDGSAGVAHVSGAGSAAVYALGPDPAPLHEAPDTPLVVAALGAVFELGERALVVSTMAGAMPVSVPLDPTRAYRDIASDDRTVVVAWSSASTGEGGAAAVVRAPGGWALVDVTHAVAGARWVAIEGDLIAVVAERDAARHTVHLFRARADGTSWAPEGTVPGWTGDVAAAPIALAGDRVFVGDPDDDTAGRDAGAVRVYSETRSGWIEDAASPILSPKATNACAFGSALRLADGLAVVGMPRCAQFDLSGGAVHVYRRGVGTYAFTARLRVDDLEPGSDLGADVAVWGTTIAAGAPGADGGAGAVYVFDSSDRVSWELVERVGPPPDVSVAGFGVRVELGADVLVVGVAENGAAESAPGVLLHQRRSGRWQRDAWLAAPDPTPGSDFDIALSGGTLVTGAARVGGGIGRVDAFARGSLGSWALLSRELGPLAGSAFGTSVAAYGAATGWRAAAGAPRAWDDAGHVEVWGSDGAPIILRGDTRGLALGESVAMEGDVVVAGAPGAFEGRGVVRVWEGSTADDLADPAAAPASGFGRAVDTSAGRVIGGAPGDPTAGVGAGAALVFE